MFLMLGNVASLKVLGLPTNGKKGWESAQTEFIMEISIVFIHMPRAELKKTCSTIIDCVAEQLSSTL